MAVAEGYGDEASAEFVELVTLGEVWVVDATTLFGVADAADLGDMRFDVGEGLVCSIK